MYEWTPERIDAMKNLWKEGLSTSEIGRRLGITKNAVVGKAHRMGMSKRASSSPVARAVPFDSVRLERLGAGMCSWPEGEPGSPDFRFCGQPTVPDKPYCSEHCSRAYVKSTKERREVAA